MCITSTVTQLILEVLDEKMQNQEVFTAYDITCAARLETKNKVKVFHKDVRAIIENEFITQQMTDYDRELRPLDLLSNQPQAQVYFPDTKSASDHDKISGSVSDPDTDSTDSTDSGDMADGEYKTTKEGRIQIPKTVLKQVTPQAGSYDVMISGNLKCVKPDARGDVRICLKQFGINGDKVRLTVDTSTDTINLDTV